MSRSRGYLILTEPGNRREYDTLSCVHCSGIIILSKKHAPAGYCGNCGGSICEHCDKIGKCIPLERALLLSEAKRDAHY